eukprot:UN13794
MATSKLVYLRTRVFLSFQPNYWYEKFLSRFLYIKPLSFFIRLF